MCLVNQKVWARKTLFWVSTYSRKSSQWLSFIFDNPAAFLFRYVSFSFLFFQPTVSQLSIWLPLRPHPVYIQLITMTLIMFLENNSFIESVFIAILNRLYRILLCILVKVRFPVAILHFWQSVCQEIQSRKCFFIPISNLGEKFSNLHLGSIQSREASENGYFSQK